MIEKCDVLLLNSFGFFPNYPPVSMAKIAATLAETDLVVKSFDLNLAFWLRLLDVEYLDNCMYNPQFGNNTQVPFPLTTNKSNHYLLKQNVIKNVEKALNILKSKKDFYDHKKLNWAVNIIFQAQQLIFYNCGTFITNKVILWPEIGFDVNNLEIIYKLSRDYDRNPFIRLYKEVLYPVLIKSKPDIIGIDMAFPWEILPVLTINNLIKKDFPGLHINFTGHGFDEITFARVAHRLSNNEKLFYEFDSIFLLRNDEGLKKFYTSIINGKTDISSVDSIAVINHKKVQISENIIEKIDEKFLVPDYGELPLDAYFTPDLVLIDKTSNKCYWSKCAFCNINLFKKSNAKVDIEQFYDRILAYKKQYDASHFFLLDEAIEPDYISDFSDLLIANKVDVIWSVRTRIDSQMDEELLSKMHLAGCRELWIGMENASEKLLEKMNKCKKPEEYIKNVESIIKICSKVGIGLHFCFLFGFPLETKEDQEINYTFFKRIQKYLKKIPFFATFNIFNLNYGSEVYRNPEKFKVNSIDKSEKNFNMINIEYTTTNGNDLRNKDFEKNVDNIAEKLCKIFVPSQTNQYLWFVLSDSPWELLYKKHYCKLGVNPFQKGGGFLESLFVKLYLIIDKTPLGKKILTFFDNKKISSTKTQIYR